MSASKKNTLCGSAPPSQPINSVISQATSSRLIDASKAMAGSKGFTFPKTPRNLTEDLPSLSAQSSSQFKQKAVQPETSQPKTSPSKTSQPKTTITTDVGISPPKYVLYSSEDVHKQVNRLLTALSETIVSNAEIRRTGEKLAKLMTAKNKSKRESGSHQHNTSSSSGKSFSTSSASPTYKIKRKSPKISRPGFAILFTREQFLFFKGSLKSVLQKCSSDFMNGTIVKGRMKVGRNTCKLCFGCDTHQYACFKSCIYKLVIVSMIFGWEFRAQKPFGFSFEESK